MGKGNYCPFDEHVSDFEMVYVDIPQFFTEEDKRNVDTWTVQALYDSWVQQLQDDVWNLLPKSFGREEKWELSEYILASNNLLTVRIADNEWSKAIIVRPPLKDGVPLGLAYHHMPVLARRIFVGLAGKGYDLYKRTGPWTSEKYQ